MLMPPLTPQNINESSAPEPRSPQTDAEATPAYRARRENEPTRVAVIGAGPVGLEAALYARSLGYKVWVFEREPEAAPDVRAWAHVSMFTPWADNATPLGWLSLIEAARIKGRKPVPSPAPGVYPTGEEFIEKYLNPLARLLGTDLYRETRVVGVGRSYLFPEDYEDAPERRAARRFRVLTRSPLEERMFTFDCVLDATGVSHSPNWLGAGGLPALGEMGSSREIFYHIPDITGRDRIRFLGKRTLLIGDGTSAATSALLLSEVLSLDLSGKVVWATKGRAELPLTYVPNDPLPRRDLLLKKANLLVAQPHPGFEHLPLTQVEAAQHSLAHGRFQATLQVDRVTRRIMFDAVIANVGSRANAQTFERHLQAEEPGFYVLGAKGSPTGDGGALLAESHRQIRDVFRRIAGDPDLDLYTQAHEHLRQHEREANAE